MGAGGETGGEGWKRFVKRHRTLVLLSAVGIAAIAVAALLVFLWVVADAQATGLVPTVLGDWTAGHVIAFLLRAVLWEILLVATWAVPVAAAAYFRWYRRLPDEERRELEGGPRRGRSAGANGGITFFTALVWLVVIWVQGRWAVPFGDWTFNDWVYTWITACLVVLVIVGIPGSIYLIWTLRRSD